MVVEIARCFHAGIDFAYAAKFVVVSNLIPRPIRLPDDRVGLGAVPGFEIFSVPLDALAETDGEEADEK